MSSQGTALAFHLPDGPSESCFQARVQFLECIARYRPQVVSDLWDKAFPEFKLAIIRHFRAEITDGIADVREYFETQQKKHLEDANSHYVHLLQRKLEAATGARSYCAFELLSERPELKETIYSVMGEFLLAFQDGLIVKLIQNKLNSEFGVDPIRSKFRFYCDVAECDEDKKLAGVIQTWSETWNLNSDWCRDHAVAVLHEWISNNQLSSVGFYTTEQAMQRTGWASASHELLFASITSRISAETAVYGMSGPKRLKFKWCGHEFERDGFNRLKESQKTYKRKSLVEFELWLGEKRRPLLLEVLHADPITNRRLEPYYEVLKRFKKVLDQHIRQILKSTNQSVRQLVKAKRKRSLADHTRWAVQFHVPPTNTLDEITKFEDDALSVAELLAERPHGMTRDEIEREFSGYQQTPGDVNAALGLLIAKELIYTKQEDSSSRVIDALRAEGRNDLFAPYNTIEDEHRAAAEIRKRIEADDKETGGLVVVRYCCVPAKRVGRTPDRSVISRAAKDILNLVGLPNDGEAKRSRAKTTV